MLYCTLYVYYENSWIISTNQKKGILSIAHNLKVAMSTHGKYTDTTCHKRFNGQSMNSMKIKKGLKKY